MCAIFTNNRTLKAFKSLNPEHRGEDNSLENMKELKDIIPVKLTHDERSQYDLEVHRFHSSLAETLHDGVSIDRWSGNISPSFPTLSKVVIGGLSVFHGPLVESSFNTMGNILDSHSTRMDIATHDAFQTARYSLRRYPDVIECLNEKRLQI